MSIVKAGFGKHGDGETVAFGERKLSVNSGWFRGNAARYRPDKRSLLSPETMKDAILDGWIPAAPVITKRTRVLAFGSCFAANIAQHLREAGFNLIGASENSEAEAESGEGEENVYTVACNEGIVNTFTIRQLMQWVYTGETPAQPLWRKKEGKELYAFSDLHRQRTRELFDSAEVFIITLGLSEVWYSKETGEVFSSTIPRDAFDEQKYGFRLSTVSENLENLSAVYNLIRQYTPNARIIFTLSPVPLLATFRPVSCITANSVSKAILRIAVDELYRTYQSDERLHYWPSYELVMEGFRDSFGRDNRHVREEILAFIMSLFEQTYCANGPSEDVILRKFYDAVAASGQLSERLTFAGPPRIEEKKGVLARLVGMFAWPKNLPNKALRLATAMTETRPEEAVLLLRRVQLDHPDERIPVAIEKIKAALREQQEDKMAQRRKRRAARGEQKREQSAAF
jgi:hypothetical protein